MVAPFRYGRRKSLECSSVKVLASVLTTVSVPLEVDLKNTHNIAGRFLYIHSEGDRGC